MYMDSPMIFDTHQSVKELIKSGFTEGQAEGQVKLIITIIEDKLATKADLKKLEAVLRSDMEKLETSLRGDMQKIEARLRGEMQKMDASLRSDMQTMENKLLTEILHTRSEIIKWVAGLMVAQLAFIAALIKIVA